MRINLERICRGSEKVFALCFVPRLPKGVSVSAAAATFDGCSIPCTVYPYVHGAETDARASRFVCCVPEVKAVGYRIELFTSAGERGELSFSSFHARWASRFNYRMNRNLAYGLRDYDKKASAQMAKIEFHECIEGARSNVLRGSVLLPLREDNDLQITCLMQDLEPVDFPYVVMGSSTTKVGSLYDNYRRIQFSGPFPKEVCNYIFVVTDANNPKCGIFEVLFGGWYESIRACTAEVMRNAQVDPAYPGWFEAHRATEGMLLEEFSVELTERPRFSIVVPLFNTPADFYRDMVASVRGQSYQEWELVLVNASPESDELSGLVEESVREDGRIRVVTLEKNLGISENTNAGIAAATGDFVCFVDHDDIIERDLLFEYAKAVNERPDIDVIYCDEDKLMPDGTYAQPFFKPDFNLDLLRNNNYICHMLTIRRSLLENLEPNTSAYDGAQDHNLTLRASERARYVYHVDRVLYHWRISSSSTAGDAGTKSYASEAGLRAVREHLERCGLSARVSLADRPFTYRVIYDVPSKHPLVSIVIPTKDHVDLLSRCIDSILEKSTYDNYEILLVENNSTKSETFAYYDEVTTAHPEVVRVASWDAEFNFSKLMNFGRRNARGEYLILLNNDTEVITPEWIEVMLGICAREDVGAVGVRLFYPDDTIQHAGVVMTGGVATHVNRYLPRGTRGYFALDDAQQDMSVVTAACLMTSVDDFDSVDGFTEELAVAFNDVDYCLKLRELGKLVVYTPEVELYHHESISRGAEDNDEKRIRFHREYAYMNYQWAPYYVKGDPYMNRNLTTLEPRNAYYHL